MSGSLLFTDSTASKPWLSNFLVACCLLILSCFYAISASSSRDANGDFPYNTVVVPLCAETMKLAISASSLALELQGKTAEEVSLLTAYTKSSLLQAAIPGFAYQLLNNLNFVTLYYVDVATFQTLSNLKILATGIAAHCLLGRRLSRGRWLSLMLLTLGALVTQLGRLRISDDGDPNASAAVPWVGYASAMVVAFISASVGVSNSIPS
jgi:UDP-sugar transporter A1/2/3